MRQLGIFIFLGVTFLAGVLLVIVKIIWSKASKKERKEYQDTFDQDRKDEHDVKR